jgi:hypothetical protein
MGFAVSKSASSSLLPGRTALHSGIWSRYRTVSQNKNKNKKTELGLTEPEEAERSYQDHFLLILCENLAIPAMMGYDTRMKEDEKESVSVSRSFTPGGGKKKRSL